MLAKVASWFLGLMRGLLGLFLPLFSVERWSGVSRAAYFIVHIAIVLVILVGLFYLNAALKMPEYIRSGPDWIKKAWLPMLALFMYTLIWASYWLWVIIKSEEIDSNWPDIDQAWRAGLAAIVQARVDLMNTPVFLILGQAEEEDAAPFRAANIPINGIPDSEGGLPVRLYVCTEARKEAIYITCPDASVVSAFCILLSRPTVAHRITGIRPGTIQRRGEQQDMTQSMTPEMMKTIMPTADSEVIDYQQIIIQADRVGGHTPPHRKMLRMYNRKNAQGQLMDDRILSFQSERLRHLCRLMTRDLAGRVPVNGILVLLPFDATDDKEEAAVLRQAVEQDLSTVRQTLGLHCPVYAMVCNMESAPGFAEFISRFPPDQRRPRVGQRFPFIPAMPRGARDPHEEVEKQLRSLASWIFTSYMRRWVYDKCQIEKAVGEDPEGILFVNSRLFYLLHEMRACEEKLGTILSGFSGYAPVDRLLFGGCYLAATGRGSEHKAFAQGVFDRILEDSRLDNSLLYWTDERTSAEARLNQLVNLGWMILVGFLLLGLACIFLYSRTSH